VVNPPFCTTTRSAIPTVVIARLMTAGTIRATEAAARAAQKQPAAQEDDRGDELDRLVEEDGRDADAQGHPLLIRNARIASPQLADGRIMLKPSLMTLTRKSSSNAPAERRRS